MKKYIGAIVVFALLLISIYILVKANHVGIAKIMGIILVIGFSIMIRVWMKKLAVSKPAPDSIKLNINHFFELKSFSPWYAALSKGERHEVNLRLRKLIPQINYTCESGEVNQEDVLAITLYIVLMNAMVGYNSCVGKTIVFYADKSVLPHLDENLKSLSVEIQVIKSDLGAVKELSDLSSIASNYPELIRKFYLL